jgi:hypothetical protein
MNKEESITISYREPIQKSDSPFLGMGLKQSVDPDVEILLLSQRNLLSGVA